MRCSKCDTEVPDTTRFCPRCHATLVFACPSCKHEQRHGGSCDNCGVDFFKYITAVVGAKKDRSEAARERMEERASLMKNILLLPFNMGIPLLRQLLTSPKRRG